MKWHLICRIEVGIESSRQSRSEHQNSNVNDTTHKCRNDHIDVNYRGKSVNSDGRKQNNQHPQKLHNPTKTPLRGVVKIREQYDNEEGDPY